MYDPDQTITVELPLAQALGLLFTTGGMTYSDRRELFSEALRKVDRGYLPYENLEEEHIREASFNNEAFPGAFVTLHSAIEDQADLALEEPRFSVLVSYFGDRGRGLLPEEQQSPGMIRNVGLDGQTIARFNTREEAERAIEAIPDLPTEDARVYIVERLD